MVLILLSIILTGFTNNNSSTAVPTSPNKVSAGSDLLAIQMVNIEILYKGKFVQLTELVPETPQSENFEEQNPLPRLKNNSVMRVNATYSTFMLSSFKIVIWHFSVDVYEVVSTGIDTFNGSLGYSEYRYEPPADVILPPNSSKAEVLIFKLALPSTGTYKFSFRALCQVYSTAAVDDATDVFYHENISFELVRNYESPPYVILYAFYGVVGIFIALVSLGMYGNRKYKDLSI
jgi:hypothetical protein